MTDGSQEQGGKVKRPDSFTEYKKSITSEQVQGYMMWLEGVMDLSRAPKLNKAAILQRLKDKDKVLAPPSENSAPVEEKKKTDYQGKEITPEMLEAAEKVAQLATALAKDSEQRNTTETKAVADVSTDGVVAPEKVKVTMDSYLDLIPGHKAWRKEQAEQKAKASGIGTSPRKPV